MKLKELIDQILVDLKNPEQSTREKAEDLLYSIKNPVAIRLLAPRVKTAHDTIRIVFCRWLGKLQHVEAIPPLLLLVTDENPYVSQEASQALDQIDDEKKTDGLIWILKGQHEFAKKYALRSLGRDRKGSAVPHLVDMLVDPKETLKEEIIEAMRLIEDPRFVRPLLAMLRHDSPRIRYYTVFTLGEIGSRIIGRKLLRLLKDPSDQVRKMTVWALAQIHYARAIRSFAQMVQSETSPYVKQELAVRLGKFDLPQAVQPLLTLKCYAQHPNVLKRAEWSLQHLSDEVKIKPLVKLCRSGKGPIKKEALIQIGKTGQPEALRPLVNALLRSSEVELRKAAALGLKYLDDTEAKPALIKAMDDTDEVAHVVALALSKLWAEEDIAKIIQLLDHLKGQDPIHISIFLRTLSQLIPESFDSAQLSSLLQRKLQSRHANVRFLAGKILCSMPSVEGHNAVRVHLQGEQDLKVKEQLQKLTRQTKQTENN